MMEVDSAMGWRWWFCSPERESTVEGRGVLGKEAVDMVQMLM